MKKLLRGFCVGLFLLFAWPFFLYKKYGNVNYKLEGATVIVSNHYANLDAFFIYLIFHKRKICFVTNTDTKKKLSTRFITWLFDCLYLDYEGVNLEFIKSCISVLKNGGVICIYPEGVVNPRKYGFFDFKGSFIFMARKASAKILPLYIYPTGSAFKKSKVYIGEEILPEEYNKYKDIDVAAMMVQSRVMEYSNKV